ncbi:MAG: hypothetical protein M3R02_06905 [Chloroflexota bacterium]|nr:hypothetical protein [Chloroflexota bacterium]
MRADCFLLADAVQESQGKLYILGGGWNTVVVPTLPAVHPSFAIAVRLLVPWNDTNQPFKFEITIQDPDAEPLLEEPLSGELTVGRPPHLSAGSDQAIPLAVTVKDLKLPKPGTYACVLTVEGEVKFRTTFDVMSAAR